VLGKVDRPAGYFVIDQQQAPREVEVHQMDAITTRLTFTLLLHNTWMPQPSLHPCVSRIPLQFPGGGITTPRT
jgi:hypothetical protein